MANLGFPRIRMIWQRPTRVDRVADAIPLNRYFQLRTNLHINAAHEADPGNTNTFWKVEPVVNAVRNRCLQLHREELCSIDEQIVPFTGRVPAKQIIRSKPNPVGLKNGVIRSGRALDVELCQGAGTEIPEETKHWTRASVVIRLAETIPEYINHKLVFDNYFTGMRLIR